MIVKFSVLCKSCGDIAFPPSALPSRRKCLAFGGIFAVLRLAPCSPVARTGRDLRCATTCSLLLAPCPLLSDQRHIPKLHDWPVINVSGHKFIYIYTRIQWFSS